MKILTYIKIGLAVVVIILAIAGFLWLRGLTKDDHIDFGTDREINLTPTQIQSMKDIGGVPCSGVRPTCGSNTPAAS